MFSYASNKNRETSFLRLWDDTQFCATSSELGLLTREFITKCSKAEQNHRETLELSLPFWISLRRGFSFRNNISASVLTMPIARSHWIHFPWDFTKKVPEFGNWGNAHFIASFIECPPFFEWKLYHQVIFGCGNWAGREVCRLLPTSEVWDRICKWMCPLSTVKNKLSKTKILEL